MLESSVEEVWLEEVRKHGGHTIKLHPFVAGIPDRLVMFPTNRFFLVELKKTDGAVSAVQKIWHKRRLTRQGIRVHVLYGSSEVRSWIRAAAAGEYDDPVN